MRKKANAFLVKYFSGKSIAYQQVFAIILPILIDQAFVICLSFVNTAMISSSGVDAVSAVSMVDSLNIFFINVLMALSTGGTVVVAQYKGSGNDKMISKATAGTISSVFLLGLGIGFIAVVLNGPILSLLFGGAEAEVFSDARIYLYGSGISYCGIAIEQAACGALRGVGETRSTLALSLIMNLTYVFLNIVFINFLHMGVLGLSISINIARYLAAVCAILYLTKINTSLNFHIKDAFHFDIDMLKRIFVIGIPFAAEQIFFNGGKLLTQTFIVFLGTYAIATNAICNSIVNLIEIPANALSLSIVTVVGQCMGRRDIDDSRKFIRSFLWLASFASIFMCAVILPLFYPLVSLFNPPEQIIANIYFIVLVTVAAQILLWAFSFILPSALRAAGDAKFTSIVAMLSMWLFRVVLGYILSIILHFGIFGVWLAMDLEWGVRGFIFIRRYRGKKWYQHHLID